MNHRLLILPFAVLAIAALSHRSVSRSGGPPVAHTGAPGEVLCTECHSLRTSNLNSVLSVTTNVPATGYVQGTTYQVTVSMSGVGARNGFQLTVKNPADQAVGSLVIPAGTSGLRIQNSSGLQYISHSMPSSSGTWTFDWVAPSTGTDNAIFYAAAYNGSQQSQSDIKTTNITVLANTTSLKNAFAQQEKGLELSIGPNPVGSTAMVSLGSSQPEADFYLYSLSGSLLHSWPQQLLRNGAASLAMPALPAGSYLLIAQAGQQQGFARLVKE